MSDQTGDHGRTARGVGRWLAPSALIAVGAAVAIIVTQNNHRATAPSGTTTTETMASTKETRSTTSRAGGRVGTYTVVAGDTLSRIALREHLTVPQLEAANPGVSPETLKVGQVLKLK